MRIIMLGAPGSGKGTQSVYITEQFGILQISSGALFRQNIKDQTELGKKVQAIIEKGELVPDEIVIEMVMERILRKDCEKGCILDGFPRTTAQAKALGESLAKVGQKIDCAVSLSVPDEAIKERMRTRIVCPKCEAQYNTVTNPPAVPGICDRCGAALTGRADDNEETVSKRLEIYHRETEPIIDFYKKEGILLEIDGTKNPDEVSEDIRKALAQYGNN